jgi:hypothetical protein
MRGSDSILTRSTINLQRSLCSSALMPAHARKNSSGRKGPRSLDTAAIYSIRLSDADIKGNVCATPGSDVGYARDAERKGGGPRYLLGFILDFSAGSLWYHRDQDWGDAPGNFSP